MGIGLVWKQTDKSCSEVSTEMWFVNGSPQLYQQVTTLPPVAYYSLYTSNKKGNKSLSIWEYGHEKNNWKKEVTLEVWLCCLFLVYKVFAIFESNFKTDNFSYIVDITLFYMFCQRCFHFSHFSSYQSGISCCTFNT
jgi:hypothetical protein